MNYYSSSAYGERYYFRFVDLEGTPWRVSIQQPNYTGAKIELTGAENPIEWMGVGDEKQDAVVLGSTGTMRVLCRPMQESIFQQGNLLPNEINDRKVVVTRRRWSVDQYVWDTIWQGFIKPEQYTQEWGSNFVLYDQNPTLGRVATEVELPIVSIIAATEFIPMPDYFDVEEKGSIADLLWYILGLTGGTFTKILTNKPVYEDFNGDVQYDGQYPYHWTQGTASTMYFYDFEGDGVRPKTIKEALETVCYPYGKLYEFQTYLAVIMSAGKYISGDNKIFELAPGSNHRFSEFDIINEVSLSSIQTKGTDNRFSLISRPSHVEFSNNIDVDKDIFDTTDKFIKPSLPCSVADITSENVIKKSWPSGPLDRYHYQFSEEYVHQSICKANYDYGITESPMFCRVVDVTTADSGATYSYSLLAPLAFLVKAGKTIAFDIPFKVRTTPGKNKIKLSFEVYAYESPIKLESGLLGGEGIGPKIIDVDEGLYIEPNNETWTPVPQTQYTSWSWPSLEYWEDNNLSVTFNEPRINDTSGKPHTIRLVLTNKNYYPGNPPHYNFYLKIKMEYVRDNAYTNEGVADEFASTLITRGQKFDLGGSGESLDINLKTLCGRTSMIINGAAYLPYNSFCDSPNYIDIQNRKMIEIGAARFLTDFVALPFLVNDNVSGNGDVYVPVAIGMSPRDCNVKLRLVSTNIGLTQPT